MAWLHTPSMEAATLQLKVVPKASRNEIAGWVGDALKVRVTAPPERGKANAAVVELIASVLGVPRDSVRLIAGETRERKVVAVDTLSPEEIRKRVAAAVEYNREKC